MSKAMIQIHHLSKKFGDFEAVRDLSLEVYEGEIFSLLGPNGAGKTTTISMLSCLLPPTAGDATIDGHAITTASLAVKQRIGIVPQEIALYEALTARQNLQFWGRMYGLDGATLTRRIDELLEQVELADRAHERVATYSGGMKRRINIAVGLLHQPRLLFMDEPTVGIDPQSRRRILDMVKALRQQGMTILYTTHYMEEAEELSDRVGIMDHGRLIALGTQAELRALVGEQETLRLSLGDGQTPISAELLQALERAPGVVHLVHTDSQVALTVHSSAEALPGIVAAAHQLGQRIRAVEMDEPDLEAVFLHLTGRALRD